MTWKYAYLRPVSFSALEIHILYFTNTEDLTLPVRHIVNLEFLADDFPYIVDFEQLNNILIVGMLRSIIIIVEEGFYYLYCSIDFSVIVLHCTYLKNIKTRLYSYLVYIDWDFLNSLIDIAIYIRFMLFIFLLQLLSKNALLNNLLQELFLLSHNHYK